MSEVSTQHWWVVKLRTFQDLVIANLAAKVREREREATRLEICLELGKVEARPRRAVEAGSGRG